MYMQKYRKKEQPVEVMPKNEPGGGCARDERERAAKYLF